MDLKSESVTVNETTYLVTELPARVMLPIVQKIADAGNNQEAQIEMISAAVSVNGQSVDAGNLGMNAFMKLMTKVQELNGMVEIEGNEPAADG